MALRTAHALLGTYIRAGVLCIAGTGRTCVAHGLPETPDSIIISPVTVGQNNPVDAFLESWDATSLVFVNSYAPAGPVYLRAAVEFSRIR